MGGGSDSCFVNLSLYQNCGAILEGTNCSSNIFLLSLFSAEYIPTVTSKYTVTVTSSKDGLVSETFSATILPNNPSNQVMEITEGSFSNVAIFPN